MTFSKLGTDTETGQLVFLPKASRLQGLYIIGIQGTGKSGLIENLIMQDIDQQIGVCVIDPHGELIDHVIARLPNTAVDKVILLDINDYQHPFGLNLFTCADLNNPTEVQKTVDQIMHVFEKLLGVSHDTPLILQYLRNCTYTLIANPGYTMAEIPLLLTDKNCRQQLVANVKRLQTRLFWQQYEQMKPSEQIEQMASIQRRVDDFLQDLILPIVGQSTTTIDLQKIMHEGRILLVKLSAQVDSVSSLIGSLMIALLLNAAYNRPAQRRQFHLYADEFQRFATEDFATLLEEARKFAIGTTIAHQNRGQLNSANSKLETDLKDRSRSVGNLVVFKVNSKDAEDLAGEFDCSPPPAKQEEVGRRKKQTPVTDVVGWLLSNRGGHKDAIVNTFANTTLRLLTDTLQEDIRQINANNASSNYRASGQSEATLLSYRNMLNKLLYEAMIHVSPLSTIPLDAMSYFLEVLGCSLYTWKIRGNTTISEQEIIAREITYQQNVTRLQTVTQQLLKAEEQAIKLRARFAIACEGRVRLMTHREFQRWYDDFYTKIRNRSELEHFVYDNLWWPTLSRHQNRLK